MNPTLVKSLFKLLLHALSHQSPHLKIAILALGGLVLLLGYGYEVFYARPKATYQGIPQTQGWAPTRWTRVLRNEGFMLGYAEGHASPLWVTYHLTTKPENKSAPPRPSHFTQDWRVLRSTHSDDYTGSGYDRGHLAPNYAIAVLYGREAQLDTFTMTNIVPQKPKLNRKLWQRLEEVEINHFSQWFKSVWVFTGPIYGEKPERLPKNSAIPIPEALYKIYLQPASDPTQAPKALAFIMPQTVQGQESLLRFVTTIDAIEQKTGLDFLPDLATAIEQEVESTQNPAAWRLAEVAQLPSRY